MKDEKNAVFITNECINVYIKQSTIQKKLQKSITISKYYKNVLNAMIEVYHRQKRLLNVVLKMEILMHFRTKAEFIY